jgi:predicted dehydrogenase
VTELLACLVVGCGAVGSGYDEPRLDGPPLTHAGAYAAHPATRLVGGVDPDPAACARFERRWGAPCTADLEAALANRPVLVSVCTPPEGRLPLVERLLEARPHAIWCEKPLAGSSEEAEQIRLRCDEIGVALQVNFHRRFDPPHRRIAEFVAAGPQPLHLDVRYSGTLRNYGPHAFDLFRWLLGEPRWVEAVGNPDEPSALLVTEGGATGFFHRVAAPPLDLFEADLFTPELRVTLGALGERVLVGRARPSGLWADTQVLDPGVQGVEEGLAGAMLGGVHSLVDHVRAGAAPLCTGHDGVAALRVVETVESAVRDGGRICLEDAV